MRNLEVPYIITRRIVEELKYNPKYGDDRECVCGHPYWKHFHYDDMNPIQCKYCSCNKFQEKIEGDKVFLVRINDYAVWKEDPEKPGYYHPFNNKSACSHWTFDSLMKSEKFITISESEVPNYLAKHNEHIKFLIWQNRNDGHGGVKGGTYEGYLEYLEEVRRFKDGKTKNI